MTTDGLCTRLNEALHRQAWAEAETYLRQALKDNLPPPVLMALVMVSTGAAKHLPARVMLIEHVLTQPQISPGVRAVIERMGDAAKRALA